MLVLHFWFVTCPVELWRAFTPLSIPYLVAMLIAYAAYALATLTVVSLLIRLIALWAKGLAKGFREGSKGSTES